VNVNATVISDSESPPSVPVPHTVPAPGDFKPIFADILVGKAIKSAFGTSAMAVGLGVAALEFPPAALLYGDLAALLSFKEGVKLLARIFHKKGQTSSKSLIE